MFLKRSYFLHSPKPREGRRPPRESAIKVWGDYKKRRIAFCSWLNISLSSRGLVCYYYLNKGKRNLERQKDGEGSTVKQTVYPPFDKTKMHTFTIGQMDSLTRFSSHCWYRSKILNQQETRIPGVRGHGMGHLWYRQGQLRGEEGQGGKEPVRFTQPRGLECCLLNQTWSWWVLEPALNHMCTNHIWPQKPQEPRQVYLVLGGWGKKNLGWLLRRKFWNEQEWVSNTKMRLF